MNRKPIKLACLSIGLFVLGCALIYGAGDDGSPILWLIVVALSLVGILWGLTSFRESK
jgi:hypothetical protein